MKITRLLGAIAVALAALSTPSYATDVIGSPLPAQTAQQWKIVANLIVSGKSMDTLRYSAHDPFASEAACNDFVANDPTFKAAAAVLPAFAKARYGDTATVSVSCSLESE